MSRISSRIGLAFPQPVNPYSRQLRQRLQIASVASTPRSRSVPSGWWRPPCVPWLARQPHAAWWDQPRAVRRHWCLRNLPDRLKIDCRISATIECCVFLPVRQSFKLSLHRGQSQRLIEFPVGQQTRIGGDLGTVKLQLQTTVKITRRPCFLLSPLDFPYGWLSKTQSPRPKLPAARPQMTPVADPSPSASAFTCTGPGVKPARIAIRISPPSACNSGSPGAW